MPYIGKSPEFGVRQRYYYTQSSGGGTSVSGTDDNGITLKFSDGNFVDVFLNGVLLVDGTDYGTSTANTISNLSAMASGDVVEVLVYDVFNIAKNQAEVTRTRYYKTASGGETSISGNDDSGVAIQFEAGAQLDVSLNGVSLVAGSDYNTSTANTIGGLTALTAGNVIEIVKYEKFVVSDTVSKAAGGTFGGAITATSFSGDGSGLTGVSAGKLLNAVSTEKLDPFTTASNTPVDITGMSVSITPSSTSSKILVIVTCGAVGNSSGGQACEVFLMRDNTNIHRSSDTGGATRATAVHNGSVNYDVSSMAFHTLDSPNTTSQVTYKLRMSTQASGLACFNRRGDDTGGNPSFAKGAAEITAIEIGV